MLTQAFTGQLRFLHAHSIPETAICRVQIRQYPVTWLPAAVYLAGRHVLEASVAAANHSALARRVEYQVASLCRFHIPVRNVRLFLGRRSLTFRAAQWCWTAGAQAAAEADETHGHAGAGRQKKSRRRDAREQHLRGQHQQHSALAPAQKPPATPGP